MVEILIVFAILAFVATGLVLVLNPKEQFLRAQDSKRRNDLPQIAIALEDYFKDRYCYPTGIPFGSEWKEGDNVYMKEVPQDPDPSTPYTYYPAQGTCPGWAVVFAKPHASWSVSGVGACTLKSDCAPQGYEEGKFICAIVGKPDCGTIAGAQLPQSYVAGGGPTPGPGGGTGSPGPGASATPASSGTPAPTAQGTTGTYFIGHKDNPQFMRADVTPELPGQGQAQTVVITVRDTTSTPITGVSATVVTDNQSKTYPMKLTDGTSLNGAWTSTWTITDSIQKILEIKFEATNQSGKSSSTKVLLN